MTQEMADTITALGTELGKWSEAFAGGPEAILKISTEYLRQRDEAQNLSLSLHNLRKKHDDAVASLRKLNPKICLNCYQGDAVTPAGDSQICSACIPF